MQDSYKTNILKYLVGKLEQQNKGTPLTYTKTQRSSSSLYNDISSNYSSVIIYSGFVPSCNTQNQDLEYSVISLYGTKTGDNEASGELVIVDKEYNIVARITEYSDGEKIKLISCINVDKKGNYYLVENKGTEYRIVLLNNITLKPVNSNTYKAIKINTYSIPNQYNWDSFYKIFKNDSNNRYFVIGNKQDNNNIVNGMVGCELNTTNNSWQYYTSTHWKSSAVFDTGYNVSWDNDNSINFQIALYEDGLKMLTKGSTDVMELKTIYKTTTEEALQSTEFIFYSNKIGYYSEYYLIENTIGIVTSYIPVYSIYRVDLETNTVNHIYTYKDQARSFAPTIMKFSFMKNNNIICYYAIHNISNGENKSIAVRFGVINGKNVYIKNTITSSTQISNRLEALLYPNIIVNYNLVTVYMVNRKYLYDIEFKYNPEGYNGVEYTSYGSVVPNMIEIIDENDTTIFNRNVINLTNYSNYYIASTLVPNYYLNNNQIRGANLYSKNNNLIVDHTLNTTKNIYEEIMMNFINKITISNINQTTKTINNNATSSFISALVNSSTNSYLGKYRINYNDNTSIVKPIANTELSVNTNYIDVTISIFVDKLIDSIDLISEDEQINYRNINCSNLEVNKYYKIVQRISIN